MKIEKAIEIMKHNKHLLGLPEQGETWKECANTNACDLAISALEKQENDGWISVKVRLPNEDGYYLTTWKGYHSIEPVTRFHRFSCGRFELDGIIAWQPLPEPYKEVE